MSHDQATPRRMNLEHTQFAHAMARPILDVRKLAQSYLDRKDEDWTWCDPEDVKRLARAVLAND